MTNNNYWMWKSLAVWCSLVIYPGLSNCLATMDRVTSLSGETRYHSCQQPCVIGAISVDQAFVSWGLGLCFSMHMWILQMGTVSHRPWSNTKESRLASRYFSRIWKERTLHLINLSEIHLHQWGFRWISCTHHGIWQGGLPVVIRSAWGWGWQHAQ